MESKNECLMQLDINKAMQINIHNKDERLQFWILARNKKNNNEQTDEIRKKKT